MEDEDQEEEEEVGGDALELCNLLGVSMQPGLMTVILILLQ